MNKTPSILVDTGFEVDQNGALDEIVIPKVVATCNAPRKVTYEGQTLNWIPSTVAALQEFGAPNLTTLVDESAFKNYTALITVNIGTLTTLTFNNTTDGKGYFYGCSNLTTVTMPDLQSLGHTGNSTGGVFYNCTSLTTVTMPKLTNIYNPSNAGSAGTFYGCTGLSIIDFPSISSITSGNYNTRGAFSNCTGLTSVTLGSEGHAVTSLGAYTFGNCTQSGLTITVYTADGNAISGSPWGATNATIVWEEA